jgi:ornithine cyclodeaminase/alanine dehydrogenase-like protein (mu-crystallin family)
MQEVEVELVRRARGRLIVDDAEACAKEAGDLIKAGVDGTSCIPLGTLLNEPDFANLAEGREDQLPSSDRTQDILNQLNRNLGIVPVARGDVTLFKSVGVGLQDVAITTLLIEKAVELGIGVQVEF